jgi:hypothetical protein
LLCETSKHCSLSKVAAIVVAKERLASSESTLRSKIFSLDKSPMDLYEENIDAREAYATVKIYTVDVVIADDHGIQMWE